MPNLSQISPHNSFHKLKPAAREEEKENRHYLVFNGSDVALVPPVQGTWGIQKVGLHEQGPLARAVSLATVAVHDLPELLVCLWKDKVKSVNETDVRFLAISSHKFSQF